MNYSFKDDSNIPSWVWPTLVFALTQVLYLHTLNPTFSNDDSAETITAASTLGLQHPPGYALAAVLGRCQSLLPIGSVSFRVNWGSSLFASLGAGLLTFLFLSLFKSSKGLKRPLFPSWIVIFCALSAGFGLAVSPTYWQNALNAKGGIYLLGVCQQLLILTVVLHQKKTRILFSGFFLLGLGLTGHWETLIPFVPGFILAHLLSERTRKIEWIKGTTFFLLSASCLLYLPLRARLYPKLDLGSPDTFSNFLMDLGRSYYSYREITVLQFFENVLRGASSWHQFSIFLIQVFKVQGSIIFEHIRSDLGWGSLLLALVGIGLWFRSFDRKPLWIVLTFWSLLWVSFFTFLGVEGGSRPWLWGKFLLPTDWVILWMAAITIAFGLLKVWSWSRLAGRALAALSLVFFLWNIGSRIGVFDQQNQVMVYDYGQNLLKSLPRNSLFFAEADEDYFSLYYLMEVERRRPDVVMIPAFTLFETWGVRQVERTSPGLGLTASAISFPDHIARMIYASSELAVKNRSLRPVAFSRFDGAFHRYYLKRQKNLSILSSGLVGILSGFSGGRFAGLPPAKLRIRGVLDDPSKLDGRLEGIQQAYFLAGVQTKR